MRAAAPAVPAARLAVLWARAPESLASFSWRLAADRLPVAEAAASFFLRVAAAFLPAADRCAFVCCAMRSSG